MNVNKNYIFSNKNHFVDSKEFDGLLYIGNTNSFIHISSDQEILLKQRKFELLDKDLFNELINFGAFVENDEEIINKYKLFGLKNNNQFFMSFWIDITDCCNFSCPYCFQGQEKQNKIISKETIDKFVKILSGYKGLNKLKIEFAGGEPLIAPDKILYMYRELKKLSIPFDKSIITNGYFLTEKNIKLLDEIDDLSYQVTLDGLENNHNIRRPNKGNENSFQVIMENLETFYNMHKESNIKFAIRMNVDKENATDVPKLNKLLKQKFKNFYQFYIVPVENFSTKQEVSRNYFTNEEYAAFLIELYEKYHIFMPNSYLPNYRIAGGFCPADRNYSYTLSASGDLLKCPCDVGSEDRIIRNIHNPNGKFNYKPEYDYLIKASKLIDKKCLDCKLFFQCLGGCPHKRLEENQCICPPMYYQIDKFLEIYYKEFLKNKNK